MSNICYHSFEYHFTRKEYVCVFCGHTIKSQNLYQVICPNCNYILNADINFGVECDNCSLQFEAFEAENKKLIMN